MRIPWRRLAWVLAAMIPLLAIGGVIWVATRDLSRYQARLTEQIRKVTGRELAAKVPLAVRIGRYPAMVAEGVTLSNAAWGSRPDLARVRKLTLFLDPVALLLGEIKIGRILLEGADILVERNDIGDSNLDMLPPPDGSGPHPSESRSLRLRTSAAFPWIGVIEVQDSVLTVAEGAGRPPVVLELVSGTLRSSAPNQPLQIEGRFGAPQASPFNLAGTAGTFDGWMRGLPGNIDLQGGFGDGTIAIKGSVGIKGTNIQITSEGPDVAAFGPYIRLPLPHGGPYAMSAKAATQRNGFKVEVTTLKVGTSDVTGEALFRADRKGVPTVTVNADINRLDVGELRSSSAAAPAAGSTSPAQPRIVPTMPFTASWLGRSAVSVTVRLGEIVGLGSKIQNGSASLVSNDQRFAFRAAATVGGGSAGFDLVYDPTGRIGQATLTASANRVSLGELSSVLGLDLGLRDAIGDIDLRLRGGGRTTRDALNSASGSIDIAITKGLWPRDQIASWPAETQRLLGGSDAGVPFNCIAGRFDVSGGVANLRRLVVDTPRTTMVGGGYVHLRTEGWEFIVAPEARDTQNAALASPLRLKGGSGRPTSAALEPNLARLIIGAGVVPSLVSQVNQAARQTGVNPCAAVAPRVEGLRPGLRAQMPAPSADLRQRAGRPTAPAQPPRRTP
ncbi:AsmA family protein [Reyranella sp.]|uniref:AsmA family protein n=1 Tax=Reyranella sp. TaxID=1929291 RepID=UPI00273081F0|nr:AsmA family protein [Reyranella sp.]MDP2376211.1 AsmA family protein [Reyranella sp.]